MYGGGGRNTRDVHSIYFEVLGEHGYVGLALFLSLLVMTWLKCRSTIRMARKSPELTWARDLAAMIQVSFVGYMSAGAFLGLAYFDFTYHLIVISVVLHLLVQNSQPGKVTVAPQGAPPSQPIAGLAMGRK
jgi:probable O-glycosylation ligase (exosortase A-associated)